MKQIKKRYEIYLYQYIFYIDKKDRFIYFLVGGSVGFS